MSCHQWREDSLCCRCVDAFGFVNGDGVEVMGMPSSFLLISIIFCASVRHLQASLDCAIDRSDSLGKT